MRSLVGTLRRRWRDALQRAPRVAEPTDTQGDAGPAGEPADPLRRQGLTPPVAALLLSGVVLLALSGLAWATSSQANPRPLPVRAPHVIALGPGISLRVSAHWAVESRSSRGVSLVHHAPAGWAYFAYDRGLPTNPARGLRNILGGQTWLGDVRARGAISAARLGDAHFDAVASEQLAGATLRVGSSSVPVVGEAAELLGTRTRRGVFILILSDTDAHFSALLPGFRSMIVSVQS